jgi:4-amino-4-deoxy-L-arabinose transferase-like glycosyltransferase
MAALTIAIGLTWTVLGLAGHDPWKPDEAYTFGLIYQILQGGSWIVPTLAGEPFVERPPLFILAAALFARLFSFVLPAHDGARLAAGFFIVVMFAFTAATSRILHGRGRGWVATLLLLGSLGLLLRAHQMIADTALLAGFAIGAYGLARSIERSRSGGFWLGTGIGLCFMSKGIGAPIVFVLAVLALRTLCAAWRTRRFAVSFAIALVALLPWLIIWPLSLYLQSPHLFVDWAWTYNLGRVISIPAPADRSQVIYYLSILPWYAWPTLPLSLWVLWGTRVSGFRRPAIELPCALFVSCFLVLSLAPDARELNALPLLIPLALLATPAVDSLRRGASNALYWFGVMGFTFFAGVFWFYWIALDIGIPQRLSAHLHKLQPGYDAQVRWFGLTVAVLLSAAWFLLLLRLKRSVERPVIIWAAGITLLWGLAMSLFVAYLDTGKSYRSMAIALAQALPNSYDCISSRNLGESVRAMLHYHAGIITHRDETPTRARACVLLLQQGIRAKPPDIPPGWHQRWEGTRPGEKHEYFWLYAIGPARSP